MEVDAKRIRAAMIAGCFNIRQLAKKAGLSESSLNLILNHGRRPNLATLGKLAKALNVPASVLIKE